MPSRQALPFLLVAALFAPLGVIAPKALVPLLFIAGLWQLGLHWRQWRRVFQGQIAAMAGLIAAWALLSSLWALDAGGALTTFAKLAGVLLAMLILLYGVGRLDKADSQPLIRAMIWSFAGSTLLLGMETITDAAGHDWLVWQGRRAEFDLTVLNRAGTMLLLGSWPVALVLWRQGFWQPALLIAVAALVVVMMGVSSANQAAVVLAVAGAIAAWFGGQMFLRVLALLMAIGVLVAPVLPTSWLAPQRMASYIDVEHYSALHRFHIWHFTAQRIAERPILGWGLDAARRIPGGDTKLPGGGHVMSVHPHNASLQIWLELGIPGALLGAVLLAGICLRAGTLPDRAERVAATGLILSGLAVGNLSFGIWQIWWIAALALSGLMFVLARTLKSG